VTEEDRSAGETGFWEIWQSFADRICGAPWIERLDSRYGQGRELITAIFLGGGWKPNLRHWRRLEGQSQRVDALAARLKGSRCVLEAYCQFLDEIGQQSLPKGFVIVVEALEAGSASEMLADQNTVFYLESLLRRYVYGEPLKLKSDPAVRNAVLKILDQLVEAGSSAAYRMRDDFVTPLSGQAAAGQR
jgi:hypothetical protein